MPRHDRFRPASAARASIASAAARLMAEDGITDYGHAKKKAARQLGLAEHGEFPDNAEVEAELRAYRSLYDDEHQELLATLRRAALELLDLLAAFNPWLTGSVLEGTAGEHSSIDILLFTDSAKEVEIFLLNRNIPFVHGAPRHEKAEAVLVVETVVADANLVIFPAAYERIRLKYRDGRPRERIRAEALRALLP
ncbi:MAG: nucleotidyltransferase domain-containing protein [Betaproteobacteria bacterium]|nr:nucleotidyltransferase domain-containing protein [Betaproteobacteria bacterium]MCL2887354.1 nucleotidyltransferase domain-containing protein [Betaproteobacteria bacterium]